MLLITPSITPKQCRPKIGYKGQTLPTELRYRYSKPWYRYRKLRYRYRLPERIPVPTKLRYWYGKARYRYNSPERISVHTKLLYWYQKLWYQYCVNIFNGEQSRTPYYLLYHSSLSAAEQSEMRYILDIVLKGNRELQ